MVVYLAIAITDWTSFAPSCFLFYYKKKEYPNPTNENFSLFWYTSLACSPEKQAINTKGTQENSCKVSIPIYDQTLDLKALSAKIGYSVHAGNYLQSIKSKLFVILVLYCSFIPT